MEKKKLIKQPGKAALPASFFGRSEGTQKDGLKAEYEDTLFATGFVHRINIQIAEADWADLLKNPVNKTRSMRPICISWIWARMRICRRNRKQNAQGRAFLPHRSA